MLPLRSLPVGPGGASGTGANVLTPATRAICHGCFRETQAPSLFTRKSKKSARGTSIQAISEELRCGKTQIYGVLKDKESIIALFESNASSSVCHSRKRTRLSEYSEINEALYEWYLLTCSKNIYPDGPQLKEKAKEIAERLEKSDFKGTNGWLEKWKKRHHIRRVTICGEPGDVCGDTVASWKERLPEILNGYAKETGCFWRSLPDKLRVW